jgi:hypothetical protein
MIMFGVHIKVPYYVRLNFPAAHRPRKRGDGFGEKFVAGDQRDAVGEHRGRVVPEDGECP